VAKYVGFISEIEDVDARRVARAQLDRMAAFADTPRCRRAELLAYFGERWPESGCGACDNCLEPREQYDATLDSQKFLSCVLRIAQKSGFGVGLQHVADVLAGADNEKIRKWFHNELSTYGIGKDRPRAEWLSLGRELVQAGYLELGQGQFPTLALSEMGLDALRNRTPILLTKSISKPAAQARPARTAADAGVVACDEGLLAQLKAKRREIADARGVPGYIVFNDATLRHMAARMPRTREEFLAVPGIGEKKYADFAAAFASVIEAAVAAAGGTRNA
jgi:ATP-dependent DNA helicase RecQ